MSRLGGGSFMAGFDPELHSVALLEKDRTGDVVLSWSYPQLESEIEPVVRERSCLARDTLPLQFSYSRYGGHWMYLYAAVNDGNAEKLARVSAFSVCIIAIAFNPEKFAALCKLLSAAYCQSGSPTSVLSIFLSVLSKGNFSSESIGSFEETQFDPRRALLATSFKDVVRMFGAEAVHLWTALLTKKRVAVYSERLGALLRLIRALPIFAWHRQDWTILRPFVILNHEAELRELEKSSGYVAGFIDEDIRNRTELYDALVDVNERTISIAEHAKNDFMLTPLQKDLANFFMQCAEREDITDQQMIVGLANKNKQILGKIESLKSEDDNGNAVITMENLQEQKLPPHLQRLIYAIAAVEGMTAGTGRSTGTASTTA